MFNFKNFARQALLALSLAVLSSAALAGPTYLVTIHTQAYSGESGLLDFSFLSVGAASAEVATVSNISGAFGAEYDRNSGVAGDLGTGLAFTTPGSLAYLTQNVILGDDLRFTLSFSGDFALPGNPDFVVGPSFVVTLFNSDMSDTLATLVQFDLIPAFFGDPATIAISSDPALVDVTEVVTAVPEPAQWLLMLSALALAGISLRRRS